MGVGIQETQDETHSASLTLEHHLRHLQREQRPPRPRRMTLDQARIYQMAALFRAASPGAAEVDPEYAARLQKRLEDELLSRRRT